MGKVSESAMIVLDCSCQTFVTLWFMSASRHGGTTRMGSNVLCKQIIFQQRFFVDSVICLEISRTQGIDRYFKLCNHGKQVMVIDKAQEQNLQFRRWL